MPGRAVWCLGMYASASTWLFNVARKILQVNRTSELHTVFVSGKEKSVSFDPSGAPTLVKSHEISDEARILDIARRSSKILITVRDPRDVVTSLIQAHGYDFEVTLGHAERSARLCVEFSQDSRAKLFRYEAEFFDQLGTVKEVSIHLGQKLDDDVLRAIYESLTRAEVEKHISQMPKKPGILKNAASGDLLDTKTQWHSHHAGRNGEIGKWKKILTSGQVKTVEKQLSFYFEQLEAF